MRYAEFVDYCDAPTFLVTGIASVSLLSTNIIQVSMFRTFERPDGALENRIVYHTVWDRDLWLASPSVYAEARQMVMRVAARPRPITGSH